VLPALAGKCITGGRLNVRKALGTASLTTPTVTVAASDANASEAGDTGAFTVTRTAAPLLA